MLGQLRQKIFFSLAFAALVYLTLTLYADAPKLAEAFLGWDWRWLPITLLAVLANYGVRFIRSRIHSIDPVPTLLWHRDVRPDETTHLCEAQAYRGGLGAISGSDVMPLILDYLDQAAMYGE